jgi:hypothetical protein
MDDDEYADCLPMAEDAIPYTAVTITEAFEKLVEVLESQPDTIARMEMQEEWLEVLRQSREFEKTAGHAPETFDAELEEHWHLRKVANLLLRFALQDEKLNACTRDPRTGETLRLPAQGWLSDEWIKTGYVPSGIWRDHAFSGDTEIPGPAATVIADKSRPIFFVQRDFETWLSEVFGRAAVGSEKVARESKETVSKERSRSRLRDSVTEAVFEIWGQATVPAYVSAIERDYEISNWFKQRGWKKGASPATINRSLSKKTK